MMHDWNVVVNLHEHSFQKAFKELQGFGIVNETDFFNVLAMKVGDINRFLENLQEWIANHPDFLTRIARIVPVTDTFTFQSPEEFEAKAKEIVLQWVPQLAGKSFHVRIHRRGFKGRLSSLDEEHFLDKILLEALEKAGTPGRITFENPDAIAIVETLGQWAGLACWKREDLERYPWMRID
ncbi:THUMP domain-containing protein [Hydrococcus rivularis]|jgi:tRNA(Ser,Leu) C12 N-acetylase TAN1|nr:THUMP domain-containing protein [Hydrococcus rivularis]